MKKILSKILDEINKDAPRLDYIRGLIEASIEEDEPKDTNIFITEKMRREYLPENHTEKDAVIFDAGFTARHFIDKQNVDEEIIPDFVKPGPIGKINS